jgi:predicted phosphodiesterase
MRYGVLSDIHANLVALEATLRALERRGVDGWLCAGDLVGYGPRPDECVARVTALGPVAVAGNHDLIALGRLPADQCTAFAAESLAWTAATIGEETRRALDALPPTAARCGIVVAHGSLDDPRAYVETPALVAGELARLRARAPDARLLVLGHTHRPVVADAAGRTLAARAPARVALDDSPVLLNPGSVGQPRGADPRARAAIVDLARGEIELHAIAWDVDAVRADLRARGRPEHSCWTPPPPLWRRAAARAARAVRRVAPGRRAGRAG